MGGYAILRKYGLAERSVSLGAPGLASLPALSPSPLCLLCTYGSVTNQLPDCAACGHAALVIMDSNALEQQAERSSGLSKFAFGHGILSQQQSN